MKVLFCWMGIFNFPKRTHACLNLFCLWANGSPCDLKYFQGSPADLKYFYDSHGDSKYVEVKFLGSPGDLKYVEVNFGKPWLTSGGSNCNISTSVFSPSFEFYCKSISTWLWLLPTAQKICSKMGDRSLFCIGAEIDYLFPRFTHPVFSLHCDRFPFKWRTFSRRETVCVCAVCSDSTCREAELISIST